VVQGHGRRDGRPAVAGRDVVGRAVQEQQADVVDRLYLRYRGNWMEAARIGSELAAPTSEHDGSCPGLVEPRHLEVYALTGTLP
jgi:hypothetical protein